MRDEFQRVVADAAALAAPLTEVQFAWKPAADAWSVGECLSHLNATARHCLPKLDEGIADGIRAGHYADAPFRYGWLDRLVVQAMEPPSCWHLGSPKAFRPAPGESRDDVLGAFHTVHEHLADRRWFSRHVHRLGRSFNSHIERVIYQAPVRRGLGMYLATIVYTSFAFFMNALYTRFDPTGPMAMAIFDGVFVAARGWVAAWIALGRVADRLRPAR